MRRFFKWLSLKIRQGFIVMRMKSCSFILRLLVLEQCFVDRHPRYVRIMEATLISLITGAIIALIFK